MYCQKCRTPLHLDKSLEDLNPAAFDLLISIGSAGKSAPKTSSSSASARIPPDRKARYEKAASTDPSPVHKRTIPAPPSYIDRTHTSTDSQDGVKTTPDMSFVMLTESQVVPPKGPGADASSTSQQEDHSLHLKGQAAGESTKALSYEVERAQRLFSILSAHSDIDHPICTECTDILLSSLQNKLQAATKERDAYVQFLKSLNSSIPTQDEVAAAEAARVKAKEQEQKAFQELLSLEAEKAELDKEIAALEEESRAVDAEEAAFWAERNAFSQKWLDFQSTRDALEVKYEHDSQQLERLARTNVYNDTFCIGHDGFFGTINGLRLGRLPNHNVEWSEINAAWGQTILLLATIAEKLDFTFRGYRLRPMGSTSRIEKIEHPQQHPETSRHQGNTSVQPSTPGVSAPKITSLDLFSSGDVPLGRLIHHRRFDAGMVAFLECLAQLGKSVDRLPYQIKGDKIGDPPLSIKLGAGFSGPSDESWTRACKYTLTCCKYLLAHTSNVVGDRQNG